MFKKFVFILALFLTALINQYAKCELVAHYKLDGDLSDSSGNGFDGIAQGGMPVFDTGVFDQAVSLTGTSGQYILTEATATMLGIEGAKPKTICVWVYTRAFNEGAPWDIGYGSNPNQFSLRTTWTNNQWRVQLWSAGDTDFTYPSQNVWVHFAMVYDGSQLILYADGEPIVDIIPPTIDLVDTNPFQIGRYENPWGPAHFNGLIDDVRIYNAMLSPKEVQTAMTGLSEDTASSSKPIPEDGAIDVPGITTLSWRPGELADTHNIYFGTDFNDVNNATTTDPLSAIVIEGVDVNNYDLGSQEYGTTIYWRVDEVSAPPDLVVYKGQVWQFTVETYAYKIPSENIIVTAISSSPENDPNNTINESGLDLNNMNLHSNNTSDMWLSSGADVEPVWIRYDFDKLYKLHEMLVWNYNDRLFLWRAGFREVTVEYSEDGQSWTELADVPEFALAGGTNRYEYDTVVEFGGIAVKSVRLVAHSNWSDAIPVPNYGLSEVRFTYIPVLAREPNPATGASDVSVDVTLRWRPGREAEQHQVYLSTDELTVIDGTAPMSTVNQSRYVPILDLGSTYFWRVDEVNNAESYPIWTGDTWSFSTIDYIVVEDFESYNDIPEGEEGSNLIYKTWMDGYDVPTNGSTIGYLTGSSLETDIVYSNRQSAPLLYNNTGDVITSEASHTFDSAQNWTAYSADSVRLYYHGSAVKFAEPSPGTIVMSGEGTDIWENTDQFRYAYKQLNGNGSIIARLDSLQERDINTKAGVMIRQTLETSSVMAASLMHASGSTALQYRTTTGGNVAEINSGAGDLAAELPVWLKITRTGNTISSERSVDGVNWEPINGGQTASTVEITMGSPVYIGLVVCSHETDVLSAATFSGVETSSNVSGDWTVAAVGDKDQTEINTLDTLFFGIEDDNGHRKDVYAPVTAVGWGNWIDWTIPYSEFTSAEVDLTRVKKIIIGVGDPSNPMGGVGTVFFDAIGYGRMTQ